MASATKPINDMRIEMSEKEYREFVEYATTKNSTSYTDDQRKAVERYKKHNRIQERES